MQPLFVTRELFQKSYYSMASGISIEPLLRFSHLCDDFIFTCLYLEKAYVKKQFEQEIYWSRDLELIDLEEVEFFDELTHFSLPTNFKKHLEKPHYMSFEEFEEYKRSFSEALNIPQFALVFRVLRKSTGKLLTLNFLVCESFATLNLLSEGGKYPPKVIEYVQAGEILTDPSEKGLMNRFFKHSSNLPLLVIRGFQPGYGFFTGFRSNSLSPVGIFNQIGMDFAHWTRNCNWNPGYWHEQKRYVKGFITNDTAEYILVNQKPIYGHVSLKLSSIIDNLPNIPMTDVLVMGKHLATNLAFQGRNVITWESTGLANGNQQYYSTDQKVSMLMAQLKKNNIAPDTPLHIIPSIIFEDQGKAFLGSLENLSNPSYTYAYRLFDFIDCRLRNFQEFIDNITHEKHLDQ